MCFFKLQYLYYISVELFLLSFDIVMSEPIKLSIEEAREKIVSLSDWLRGLDFDAQTPENQVEISQLVIMLSKGVEVFVNKTER